MVHIAFMFHHLNARAGILRFGEARLLGRRLDTLRNENTVEAEIAAQSGADGTRTEKGNIAA